MYKRLEDSHIVLEKTVEERTGELKARSIELEQANRAKSDFLATMSHEIRTPLNAVIGLSEIEIRERNYHKELITTEDTELHGGFNNKNHYLRETPWLESSMENITQIHQSGKYLLGIINDILDISKIESGNIELVNTEYDTAQMISEVVNLNKVRIANKPIDFTVDIEDDFPAKLIGDELRIKQILNNLLSNAVKFTEQGEITLRIFKPQRAQRSQRNSEDSNIDLCVLGDLCVSNSLPICFEVKDSGIGIKPEDIEKLFKDYSQLDTGANRKYEGTGLGLAITKRLVEMMGGTITVESEYGKGSCFTAQIIQQLTKKEEEKPQRTQRTQRDSLDPNIHLCDLSVLCGEKSFPNARVLAVDDVAENLMVVKKMLTPYGLQIDTADSGEEALEKIKDNSYDLIFMDHMMPGMDGIETMQKIKRTFGADKIENRKERCPPVVMLTAAAMTGMKEYYLEQGFDDYLSKPINAKELDEILRRWLTNDDHSSFEQTPLAISVETKERQLDKLKHNRFTLLMKLKGALESNEAIEAESILDKMGNIFTEPEDRKLYFKLYHLMLTGETEKMLEEISRNEE